MNSFNIVGEYADADSQHPSIPTQEFILKGITSLIPEAIFSVSYFHSGSNITYKIFAESKNYFLRLSNKRWELEDLVFEENLIKALVDLPFVPRFLSLPSVSIVGDHIFSLGAYWGVITEEIVGNTFDKKAHDVSIVGELMAKLHHSTSKISKLPVHRSRLISDSYFLNNFEERLIDSYQGESEYIENVLNIEFNSTCLLIRNCIQNIYESTSANIQILSKGYIHNDITSNNLKVSHKGTISGLLDYEYANFRELIYELAWTIGTICMENGSLDINATQDLIESYEYFRGRSLSQLEKYYLPRFTQLALIASIKWSIDQVCQFNIKNTRYLESNIMALSNSGILYKILN